ncbi:MAG TPA: phenylalanine--tRNA ligase subunit beta [Candidatus Pelagibacter sp.]|jgi:phenylalanyl-tRNA synthetase beta chain|nr:phenylalanine--tRNA ligase subunit beta [Candidatus Pelagibacter sp.]
MITSLSWLKSHLSTKANLKQIVERLTEIGLEVESVKSPGNDLDNFIICKVVKSQKHPNADKLKICDVDIGKENLVKIVCGAPNARDGLFTVYAPPGAVIPKTKMKLKIAKIRGIESFGMLCSRSELDQSLDKDGIIELNKKEKNIGEKFFKNSLEEVIDISVTPNRPDCLGIRGIARDLAASGLGQLKKQPPIKIKQKFKQPIKVSISKEKNQGCGVFGSIYIKNIENKESPEWLKNKIISLGLKPISAIVDITNYIMFDLNRPLHAYDADKINKEIIVRNSKKGESFEALDNKKYILDNNMCAITDKSGVLGLGGIIGGTRSGTELSTKNILLESAYFYPSEIRKTAKSLNIDTDAKYRFERGIDPNSIKTGLELAMCMVLDICGGEASKFSFEGKLKSNNKIIDLNYEKFLNVVGFSIISSEIKKILSSLGCEVKPGKKSIKVLPPSWRPDLKEDIDLIEELVRIKGYKNIPLITPEKENIKETLNSKQKLFHFSQRIVASKGFTEAVTWSFTDSKVDNFFSDLKEEIRLSNPISNDLDVLRSSLYTNLMIGAKKNIHRNFEDLMLFEIGPVFKGKEPGKQSTMIGAIKTGKHSRKNWIEKERSFDIFDIKSDVLRTLSEIGIDSKKIIISNKTKKWYHPGRSGLLSLGSISGPELAYFGEIHPSIIKKLDLRVESVLGFEIFLDNIPEFRKKIRETKPQFIVSDYQKVTRDFAFVIDEKFSSGEIINLVKNIDKELIKTVKIFDIYQGENIESGKKSIAFSVTFEPKDKTLSEGDIDQISKKIISSVQSVTAATLRS